MKDKIAKTSEILIKVQQDADRVPVNIQWQSTDNPQGAAPQACKAMLVSLFDEATKDTLKIDLWTKEMQIVEMDRFFFQTLRGMCDTYARATQNRALAEEMQRFVHYFGEQVGIVPKQ